MKKAVYLPVVFFFSCFFVKMAAQAPQIDAAFPKNQRISTPAGEDIVAIFDVPIDPASVNGQTFRVFGHWSGPAPGDFEFLNGNTKVRFHPNEDFFAGEWVVVQLSKGIKSATGENLAKPYAWGFWIATAMGKLNQPLVQTIELRLPSETYLQTYGAYAGDMNNDGYSDLVAVSESADDLRILLNDGTGQYPSFTVYDTGEDSTPSPSEGADFNNDGEIDLVVTTAWDSEVRVLTGDGLGSFSSMETYFTSNGVRGVVVGDFNGDGWDDMLTTNRLAGNISIFMNDGDGTFSASGMNLPNMDENACAMTDINNDGILDVFFATYNSEQVGVLLGDGEGGFEMSVVKSVQGKPWMIGFGDLNNDGNADVVSVNSNSNKSAVLFGDGQGGLSEPTHYAPSNHGFPLAVDLGDIDGDGDLDIVTSNYSAKTYTVFENDGVGQLTAPVTLNAVKASSCAILHDRDNDGDLDITATDEEADVILLFENPGSSINSVAELERESFQFSVYPNPVSKKLTANFFLFENKEATVTVLDLRNGEVATVAEKWFPAGNNSIEWAIPAGFSAGVYLMKLETGGIEVVKKWVLAE